MTYESQKVAIKYFVISAVFFGLQVIVGLLLAAKYIWPDPLIGFLPFNTARAIHTNLLVVWMIFGFMGGTYYIVPEESGTELFSKKLANLLFWELAAIARPMSNPGIWFILESPRRERFSDYVSSVLKRVSDL
jgi:nitric oxide reductase subunit B